MIQQLYDFADINGGQLPMPTYFILDEFANIGQIPDFDKKISTSRSRKISFSVILQNLDQLEAVYKEAHETILGNCDTHLFLGSNSQKTVEYFSKALGEKTITRDNISVNKDRDNWKQGLSQSDQIMGRALMTPDELRRMNEDMCIIYEKGIKPVKANKYYYFKYPEGKLIKKYKSDHNNVQVERGPWRKYNPYNPYVENQDNKGGNPQSLENLDSLFQEEDELKTDSSPASQLPLDTNQKEESKKGEELTDIQKELEAKFDELFGSLED